MTSSRLFEPKLVIASRSSSVFCTSWPIVSTASPLEAVARTLGQVELLDRELEVRGRRRRGRHLAELETLGGVRQLGDEADEAPQRVAGRRQRLTRRDRAVGLDLDRELVVVRGLLHAGGLDVERDAPHGREDRVDRNHTDRRGPLVALGREVAAALLDGQVDGEAALGVDRRDVQVGVEDLDVGGGLDVAGEDVARAALVEAQRHGLLRGAAEDDVLDVQDEVGDVLLDTRDGVELVEGLVEPDLGDGGTRDRRQQRPAEAVAEGVAETGLERPDHERLGVAFGLAGLDFGALDDQHAETLPIVSIDGSRRIPEGSYFE